MCRTDDAVVCEAWQSSATVDKIQSDKAPRPRQPEAIDLRPHLLTRRHSERVLDQLGTPSEALLLSK